MLIGVVADDITGGTDIASAMHEAGLRVLQTIGVPTAPLPPVDAVIVSQKVRMSPPGEAVQASVAAARWLQDHGARSVYFKYCSTFDSTDRGNIGPVVAALLDEVGESFTIACPANPAQGRTVYQGHLFVGDRLLSETPMRDHPVTPMTDADIVRLLRRQLHRPVGLVTLDVVRSGPLATRRCFEELQRQGCSVAVADATTDDDLAVLAEACEGRKLATGAAGLGAALARRLGPPEPVPHDPERPSTYGPAAVLSGSCSAATLAQVRHLADSVASRPVTPADSETDALATLTAWACEHARREDIMLYSTAEPSDVQRDQARFGREASARTIESVFSAVASALGACGVRTFVVAGGETSGAVLEALGVRTIRLGQAIAPGVPAAVSVDPPGFAFALKSGNFGGVDFFSRALRTLRGA